MTNLGYFFHPKMVILRKCSIFSYCIFLCRSCDFIDWTVFRQGFLFGSSELLRRKLVGIFWKAALHRCSSTRAHVVMQ